MPRRTPPSAVAPAPRPELLALLHAAKEAPEDDAPRLVLADWLEEHGGPADIARAELIRVSCEVARLGQDHPRRRALDKRLKELTEKYQADWFGPLPELGYCNQRRGLVQLNGTPGRFLTKAAAALPATEAWAWIDWVGIWSVSDKAAAQLADGPLFEGLVSVSLHLHDGGAAALAASSRLRSLRHLNLRAGRVGDAGALALAESPNLTNLVSLDLAHNRLGDAGLAALGNSSQLNQLGALILLKNRIANRGTTPAGFAALARGTGLPSLERLDLSSNRVGGVGAAALADSPLAARLRELDLSHCNINAAGAVALAGSRNVSNLRVLRLWGNRIGDEGARALLASPSFDNIAQLGLSRNSGIRPATLTLLRKRFGDRLLI